MYEFDSIADYYDAMYADRKDDVEFYLQVAREFGGPVLECGCGTGRVLIPIAKAGIKITGIDDSEGMLRVAREKLQQERLIVPLIQQDMRTFALEARFRLCLVPFRAFLHLLTLEDQDRALRRIHQHLQADGRLVLDVFAPSYPLLAKGATTIRLEPKVLPGGRKVEIVDQVNYDHVHQHIHVERRYEEVERDGSRHKEVLPFSLRYTFRYELQAQLEKNGFRIEDVYGEFDRRPYDYESGEIIFVCQKD